MRRGWALVCVLLALDARAADFAVNSTVDAPDASPGDGVCQTASPGTCTLRAAIQEANAFAGPDVIHLGPQTYTLTLAGADEDLAATGDLDIRDDVTIQGVDAATTIVDGGGLDRVFHVVSMPATLGVTIGDVTIRNGATTDAPGAGILHADSGSLVIAHAILSGNHVAGTTPSATGGAISSNGNGALTIDTATFTGNGAQRGAAVFHNGSLTLIGSTLDGNTPGNSAVIDSYGEVHVAGCTFAGNPGLVLAAIGGQLTNSTFTGNAGGAVIETFSPGGLSIVNTTIADNPASPAIYAFAPISITNTVVFQTGPGSACLNGGSPVTSLGHNVDSDGTCAAGGPGDRPSRDPLLLPLANNGGPTQTMLPMPGSPLANAGGANACPGIDQRGVARNVGPENGCDIGAVEFSVPEPGALALGTVAALALGALRRRRG
jgi:CSLREA domain-containing protein